MSGALRILFTVFISSYHPAYGASCISDHGILNVSYLHQFVRSSVFELANPHDPLSDATYYEDMMIDKTSQSSRLLYCKEIPTYKQHVREFYGEIQTCRPVGESDVEAAFTKNKTNTAIRRRSALYELFNYSCRFSEEVREALIDKGYSDLADQFVGIADNGLEHSDSTRFDLAKV